jgi:hypothetical protein
LLIQPQSLLAADHAGSIRHALLERADLAGIWWCDELIFSANVRVCAPLLRRHTGGSPNRDDRAVDRWEGPSVETRPPVPPPSPSPARRRGSPSTWAHLVAQGSLPDVDLVGDAGTLGDLATATAGFRDQYYGLAPFVIECLDGDDRHFPKLITSGLVDPGRSRWGERPARFAGRTWLAPRVDRRALAAEAPRLSAWVEARLVPKVVLATQTRVLEPAVDPAGVWIPSVPVIAVHAEEADLWRVAAVLLAPAASVWALATFRGAALGSQAIKLSARQVLHVPLPADRAAWSAAAETLQAGGPDRIHRVAGLMNEAYGAATEVLSWWQARLPKPAGTALG